MQTETFITGKDASLESSIAAMTGKLAALGFHVEERTWLNPVEGIWSVHISERDCPLMFTNQGTTKLAALASALGEFLSASPATISGRIIIWAGDCQSRFHYPREQWFKPSDGTGGNCSPELHQFYNPEAQSTLVRWWISTPATPSAHCALPTSVNETAPAYGSRSTSSATCMSAAACQRATRQ